jgi:hypothetical protein
MFDAWIIVIRSCFRPIVVNIDAKQKAIGVKLEDLGAPFRASQRTQVAVPQEASESKPAISGCSVVLLEIPACACPK